MAAKKFTQFDPYRLSALQRAVLIPYFGIGALLNPERGDLVAGLGDATAFASLKKMTATMKKTPSGKALLQDKPYISSATLNPAELRLMPADSLGKKYIDFMDHHHFSADARSRVRFMHDEEEAFVMTRYRQVHDFWHVLTELPPTLLGEVSLKVFEHQVTGLPSCALSGTLGQLKLSSSDRYLLWSRYIPWAVRAAKKARAGSSSSDSSTSCSSSSSGSSAPTTDLLSYLYEAPSNLMKPIEQVRQELGLEKAPSPAATH